ncbi:MAG TPA: TetR/AcrR family transcriptional regulator [Candidatus Limnocylindrales bacterium]|nr:TetR/AcrR family transcriptional regulator [Candidatus Limnocylindrales bacterium]
MNTRSRPSSQEVRDRLLDAAEELLADRQPAAITSRDVARAAGLSDGVLYNHFADKHDLLLAALVRRFDRLTAAYGELEPPDDGPVQERLGEIVRRAHAVQREVLPMLANLVGDPPLLGRFLTEIHRAPLGGPRFHEPVRAFLAAEQEAGRLASFDLDGATDAIIGTALFAGLLGILGHHPARALDERLEAFSRTLLTGLQHGGAGR